LRVAQQVRARDVVAVADFRASHAAEKFLCPIRASAVEAVRLVMVDPLHFKAAV
jgi:hypothetical protein